MSLRTKDIQACVCLFFMTLVSCGSSHAQSTWNPCVPYIGTSLHSHQSEKCADPSTLNHKVVTGYQGWFNCQGDGANLGWTHWAKNGAKPVAPGNVCVDLWPDTDELTADELFETGFTNDDGSKAKVFSSFQRETVLRHFRWMREYGIDGALVQRFANGLESPALRFHKDAVLSHCRLGANNEGRTYAVMYDLSGLSEGGVDGVIDDWKMLRNEMGIGKDPAYQHHDGKPLVAVWGIGFNDGRQYTLQECRKLVEFLKSDGCAVMLGVPTGWRELNRDAVSDKALLELIKLADVVSPWSVGRYRNPEEVVRHVEKCWKPDVRWCEQNHLSYLPVVFPGFSWHNLKPTAPLDQIPRLKGDFLWSQLMGAKSAGAIMVYVAMFDEVDEGTAIFKCSNHPPGGSKAFLTLEGVPTDHYLWLTGQAANVFHGQTPISILQPKRAGTD